MAKGGRKAAPAMAKPDAQERKLRAYCERVKKSGGAGGGGKRIVLSAARPGGDPVAAGLLEYSSRYVAGMAVPVAGKRGARITAAAGAAGGPPDNNELKLILQVIEKIYKITEEVRGQLRELFAGTTVKRAEWWGAELLFTPGASAALQALVAALPDVEAVFGLMMVSRTATLIYLVVSAGGKMLAQRLAARTTGRGAKAVIYFYAIPFIDPA